MKVNNTEKCKYYDVTYSGNEYERHSTIIHNIIMENMFYKSIMISRNHCIFIMDLEASKIYDEAMEIKGD